MNVWMIFWLILAVGVFGFFIWTFVILMQQKKSWRLYAEKRKLRYKGGTLMASPNVSGTVDDHTVNLFTSEHLSEDGRGTRKLTAIEVSLHSKMPVFGGIASAGMVALIKELNLKQEYRPEHPDWDKTYIAAANNRFVLEAYLNEERIKALSGLMKVPKVWVIFIFREEAMLLRVDTADPLETPQKIDSLVNEANDAR